MLYVLYESPGIHSGRALRSELSKLLKLPVLGGFPERLANAARKFGAPSHVINLGCPRELPYESIVFNSREKVLASSDKRRARIAFRDALVPAPKLYLHTADVPDTAFPIVGRTSHHKKGLGFWLCRNRRELDRASAAGATHFLEFIANTREYRVHVFSKTGALGTTERSTDDFVSVKISEKVWQGQGEPNPDEPQKNHDFGWTFLGQQDRREEELDVVRHVAKQAMSCLKMDFGAVDVMYQIRNKIPYVLEVNSTPSMSDDNANTCEVYAERFARFITPEVK